MQNIRINYSKSPELKQLFARKTPGDKCEFEVCMQVNEVSADEVIGTLEKITFESLDGGDKKEKEAEPDAEEPAMIEMNVGGKKVPLETSVY